MNDLKDAIKKGTKAWSDVPADWVEELRGNLSQTKGKEHMKKRPAGGVVVDIPNNTRSGGQPVRWNAPVGDPALIPKDV